MTDSQCKHLVSKSVFTRFYFHPRAYIRLRGLGLVLETLALPGLRHIQAQTVILPTEELIYWPPSQERPSHTPTNSNRWTRASTPQPLASLSYVFYIYHLTGMHQEPGSSPESDHCFPWLPCSSHYSGISVPLPYPHHNWWKDVLVHRFTCYCPLAFTWRNAIEKHCFPCCCHPYSRDKHTEELHLTCMPSQLHPWVAFLEGADNW